MDALPGAVTDYGDVDPTKVTKADILRMQEKADTRTTTEELFTMNDLRLRLYDQLPPDEAVLKAWTVPGAHPAIHREAQQKVREAMPLLARALDRMGR